MKFPVPSTWAARLGISFQRLGFVVSVGLCLTAVFVIGGLLRNDSVFSAVSVISPAHTHARPKPAVEPKLMTFIAVGDVMLSRTVSDKMRQKGFDYPFAAMNSYLHTADFVFGNLETSITDGPRILTDQMTFRADPGAEDALQRANVAVVSLANNHFPNFGERGMRDTFAALDRAGIAHAGAGIEAAAARQPAVLARHGLRVAFLAYNDTDVVPDNYAASARRAGTVFMDIGPMTADVAAARETSDVVIVSMHSGTEYTPTPNARQTAFAQAAIDAGADLVIGHHPHVIQTAVIYHRKPILYSLGNFIFDQMWSEDTRHGLAAQIELNSGGVTRITFQPVVIDSYSQPRAASAEEARQMLQRLALPDVVETGVWNMPAAE